MASIDTKVSGILDQVKNHENRILDLERRAVTKSQDDDSGLKKLLGKCLFYAILIIASLTGAGTLIQKFICN